MCMLLRVRVLMRTHVHVEQIVELRNVQEEMESEVEDMASHTADYCNGG